MKVKNFATTCAACHEAQIQGAGMSVKGAAFFTVPGNRRARHSRAKESASANGRNLPTAKSPLIMELLLRRQPAMADALDQLRGVDLLDLTKATPGAVRRRGAIRLGREEVALPSRGRWTILSAQATRREKSRRPGSKSARGASRAQEEWMPHLLTEVTNYQNGIKPPFPKPRERQHHAHARFA